MDVRPRGQAQMNVAIPDPPRESVVRQIILLGLLPSDGVWGLQFSTSWRIHHQKKGGTEGFQLSSVQ